MSPSSARRSARRSRPGPVSARPGRRGAGVGTAATIRVAASREEPTRHTVAVVDRSPSFLAALASAAVPGLDPVTVEALPSTPEQHFDVGFVMDSQHRRWVVRAPRDEMAAAEMDRSVVMLGMIARRLPFGVPMPRGFIALRSGGRAMVYPYLPGHHIEMTALPPGPGVAAEIGRALAALHNLDIRLFEEAGLPAYDADDYRARRLTDLDRAAATGRIPMALLARWEAALEDVALWRFAAVPTHGALTAEHILVSFSDDADASTGQVRALTGWERAQVADPADDFAELVAIAPPQAVDTVLEAYALSRVERPDANLLVRARLVSELAVLTDLMDAVARRRLDHADVLTTELRRLDDVIHTSDDPHLNLAPVTVRTRRPSAAEPHGSEGGDTVEVSEESPGWP